MIYRLLVSVHQTPLSSVIPRFVSTSAVRKLDLKTHRKLNNEPLSRKLRVSDGVPASYSLVYRTSVENYLEPSKYIGLGAAVLSLGLTPYLIMQTSQTGVMGIENYTISTNHEMWGFWLILILHTLACSRKSYCTPLRVYYSEDQDNFLFSFNHWINPFKRSVVSVGPGDLDHVPKMSDPWKLNPWRHRLTPQKRNIYLISHWFAKPYFYKKLLGIDSGDSQDDYDEFTRFS